MTDLGAGLFAWVKTVGAVTAIIGADDACQFYPVAVQESKTPPLIVYEEAKDKAFHTHDSLPTLASSSVSFACIATSTTDATALADALYTALSAFFTARGMMGDVNVQGVLYETSSPTYQWEEQQFAVDATYKFWFTL